MTKVPRVTTKELKSYWRRHDIKQTVSNKDVRRALARGNARAQALEDTREANRQKHLPKKA